MASYSASEILTHAADARGTAEATLNGLTEAQLLWTPGGGRWSAGMITDHLVRSDTAVFDLFDQALAAAPAGSPHPYKFTENLVIGSLGPEGTLKLPVPPMFEPAQPAAPLTTVAEFFRAHDRLVEIATVALTKDLSGIKIESPAKKGFRIRALPYLHAMFQHERYHLGQVKALIEELGFPR